MKYELAESILRSTMSHWEIAKMSQEIKDLHWKKDVLTESILQRHHCQRRGLWKELKVKMEGMNLRRNAPDAAGG